VKNLVFILWNDFQEAVIIKGTSSSLNQNSNSQDPRKIFSCPVWSGIGNDVNERGFARKSLIFKVEEEAHNDTNGGYTTPQDLVLAGSTTNTN
jgi:hypothetical protein